MQKNEVHYYTLFSAYGLMYLRQVIYLLSYLENYAND